MLFIFAYYSYRKLITSDLLQLTPPILARFLLANNLSLVPRISWGDFMSHFISLQSKYV